MFDNPEAQIIQKPLFESSKESIRTINNAKLAHLRCEKKNIRETQFISKTLFIEDLEPDEWQIQGEAFSSNSSAHFKEESLKSRALTEAPVETGKQSGVTLTNQDETKHQLSHFLTLVPTDTTKSEDTIFLGLTPDLHSIEQIEWKYRKETKTLQIDFVKRIDETTEERNWEWDIVYGRGKRQEILKQYQDVFKERLEQLRVEGNILPEKDTGKKWWFSWPKYGKWVTQKDIESQLEHLQTLGFDTVMVDDGWIKEDMYGDWEVDEQAFHNMKGLAQQVKDKNMRFGMWMAPFLADKNSKVAKAHPDWILKDAMPRDEIGKKTIALGMQIQKECGIKNLFAPAYSLDISLKPARQYIIGKIMNLVDLGVEDLKLDFLGSTLLGVPKDKSKTGLEWQMQFWRELRSELKAKGKETVHLSSCTVPLVLTPLFESSRITNDSLLPPIFNYSLYKKLFDAAGSDKFYAPFLNSTFLTILKRFFLPNTKDEFKTIPDFISRVNSDMYDDAARVLEQRLETWGEDLSRGYSVDGMHCEVGAEENMLNSSKVTAVNGRLMSIINKYPYLNRTYGDQFSNSEVFSHWRSQMKPAA